MRKHVFICMGMVLWLLLTPAACSSSSDIVSDEIVDENSPSSQESVDENEVEDTTSGSITQGIGFCANDFYPLRSDKTWHYSITSGDVDSEYSITFKDITDSSFMSVQTFPGMTNEVEWQCDANGMLSSSYSNMSFASTSDVSYDTLEVSGVALLPDDQWEIGSSWSMTYKVQVTINSGGTEIQAEGQIDINREIAAIEEISVPAGTYSNAYRVDSIGTMDITLMGSQTSTPLVYSDWYVRDVGLVKSSSNEADMPYEMVLDSFE